MKRLFQITILIGILTGSAHSAHAQRKAERSASGRAAYGNTVPEFKASKKKNQKAKKKAAKSAKRKKVRNHPSSYFTGRPY
jgi:hypothetical protein